MSNDVVSSLVGMIDRGVGNPMKGHSTALKSLLCWHSGDLTKGDFDVKSLCWCTGEKSKGLVIEDLIWVHPRTHAPPASATKEYFWVTYQRNKELAERNKALTELESRGFGHNGTVRSTRDRGLRCCNTNS